MNNSTFHLQYSDSFSEALFMSVNNYSFVTLENALNEVFHSLNYKSFLLTIGMNTVAIMMPFPDVFKVFDSHSRDLYGMPSMSGYCVLISVEGFQNLAQYFHLTSQSSASNVYIPFELMGVSCVMPMDICNDNVNGESILSDNLESVASSENKGKQCAKLKEYNNLRKIQRQNESLKEKETRLEKIQLQKKARKENESNEEREHRLAKARLFNDQRKIQRQNESPAEKNVRIKKHSFKREFQRKMNLKKKCSKDLLKQESIMTEKKFKDKMNLLKKK